MRENTAINHLGNISLNDVWETPPNLLENFCREQNLPFPKIDVAGTLKNKQCERVITKEQDTLKQEYDEDFFGNFPYSEMKVMMKHAFEQHRKHNVNGIILAFHKSGNDWYHKYVYNKKEDIYYARVIPIQHRIQFWLDGKPYLYWSKKRKKWVAGHAPYDSCWIVYQKDISYFKLEPKIFPRRF